MDAEDKAQVPRFVRFLPPKNAVLAHRAASACSRATLRPPR